MHYIPYRKYRKFYSDYVALPDEVQARLNSFLLLVCTDPDDKGVTDVCRTTPAFPEAKAYPIGWGYHLYWEVERSIAGKPLVVVLRGIGQVVGAL